MELLYNDYIIAGSKHELNLDSDLRAQIGKQLKELQTEYNNEKAKNLYKKAEIEVTTLMDKDGLAKFVSTNDFKKSFSLLQEMRGQNSSESASNQTQVEDLTEIDWKILLTGSFEKEYFLNQDILSENSNSPFLYILSSGTVAYKANKRSESRVLFETSQKDFFLGSYQLFYTKDQKSPVSIVAISPKVNLKCLNISFLANLFVANPKLGIKFYNVLGKQLAEALFQFNLGFTTLNTTLNPSPNALRLSQCTPNEQNKAHDNQALFLKTFPSLLSDEQLICCLLFLSSFPSFHSSTVPHLWTTFLFSQRNFSFLCCFRFIQK